MIHTEQGYQPFIIVGTSHGPLFVPNHAVGRESATLVPSLAAYDTAFATYRDATGEWLVMGGKHGIVMLPISVIKASNFAASGFAVESDNAANDR